MKHENLTQKVVFLIDSMLPSAKKHYVLFYFIVSGLKITRIGDGNPDSNLEPHCIYEYSPACCSRMSRSEIYL
jgi:hypothetical protein